MARSNDESWVLASSVGATATMVAAGRAIATRDPRGLINDPFAEPLVRAVGIDFFTKMIDGELDITEIDPESAPRVQANIDEVALRTKYFDHYFSRATDVGIRQAVILASGLDSRAYRLPWPDATTVYELDQPDVIEFKASTLAGMGAVPTAQRRTVSIDLRDDWPAALRAAGFQDGSPTAWLAEGLLIYLPPEAQDRLFDNITALSAPGSTIATEYVPGLRNFDPEKARQATDSFREHGVDIDMPSLIFHGERSHVIDYLKSKGWQMSSTPRGELFVRNGLVVPAPDDNDPLGEIVYVSGTFQNR